MHYCFKKKATPSENRATNPNDSGESANCMNIRPREVLTKTATTWALLFLLMGSGAAQSNPPLSSVSGSQAPLQKPETKESNSQYVGSESCKKCHEFLYTGFQRTKHYQTVFDKRRGPAFQGCEGCHGPGRSHVESEGNPQKIRSFKNIFTDVKKTTQWCLDCHQYESEHNNFARSAHMSVNIGCLDCHSVHHAKVTEYLLSNEQSQLCVHCHKNVGSEFDRPFRHPVNEHLMQCSDCHNQHGGTNAHMLRSAAGQVEVCTKCHTSMAGPFAFEHSPVKLEGCTACHVPHGSGNPRLLRRSEVNQLCLECHTFTTNSIVKAPPSFHNQMQQYQACTMCHVQIHGSHSDRYFYR